MIIKDNDRLNIVCTATELHKHVPLIKEYIDNGKRFDIYFRKELGVPKGLTNKKTYKGKNTRYT